LSTSEQSDSDAKSFMLKEYETIASAFFDLSRQKTEMFRFYLILVTIPITLLAAIIGLQKQTADFFALPGLIVLVLLAISIAGLLMTSLIVGLRFEAIVYAKTVNLARRFFIDSNSDKKLILYTLLPNGDDYPKFNEQPLETTKRKWRWQLGTGAIFLEVVLMALLNATYFSFAVINLVRSTGPVITIISGLIGWILFFLLHVGGYLFIASKRDSRWSIKLKSKEVNSKEEMP
jgi:hypothetical protein